MGNDIKLYKAEVVEILNDEQVFKSLALATFKGLNKDTIGKALMQGRMKGFTIQDFMVGNVYAIPFSNSFSLVNSIDHVRKIAMRSGQSGKSAPTFTETEKGIESCSVTVWKAGGDERGYTATVYFQEYNTGKNLWVTKPRTMIAKVAEMHALRAAFPEELQNVYVEEEMQKEQIIEVEANEASEEDVSAAVGVMKTLKKLEDLQKFYLELPKLVKIDQKVIDIYNERKLKLQDSPSQPKK